MWHARQRLEAPSIVSCVDLATVIHRGYSPRLTAVINRKKPQYFAVITLGFSSGSWSDLCLFPTSSSLQQRWEPVFGQRRGRAIPRRGIAASSVQAKDYSAVKYL